MAADLSGWQDNPQQPGPVPDWIIMGFQDETGVQVIATSLLEKAQHDKHFDGYDVGPEVHGKPAREPRWRSILGLMFTRYSSVSAPTFHGAVAKLLEVWRPE